MCEKDDHDFQLATKTIKNKDGSEETYLRIFCRKCGEPRDLK